MRMQMKGSDVQLDLGNKEACCRRRSVYNGQNIPISQISGVSSARRLSSSDLGQHCR